MTPIRTAARVGRLLAALSLPVLVGCATSRTVSGRVLPGEVGIVTIVPANDERLEDHGLGGVRIRITDAGSAMGSVAEATSAADGSFSFRIPEGAMTQRVGLHATSDEIVPFSGPVLLPMDDRRLLVIVEPASGSAGRVR